MALTLALRLPAPRKPALSQVLFAAGGWSALLTSGLTTMSFMQCGGACIDTTVMTAAGSFAFGLLAFGALSAFARTQP